MSADSIRWPPTHCPALFGAADGSDPSSPRSLYFGTGSTGIGVGYLSLHAIPERAGPQAWQHPVSTDYGARVVGAVYAQ